MFLNYQQSPKQCHHTWPSKTDDKGILNGRKPWTLFRVLSMCTLRTHLWKLNWSQTALSGNLLGILKESFQTKVHIFVRLSNQGGGWKCTSKLDTLAIKPSPGIASKSSISTAGSCFPWEWSTTALFHNTIPRLVSINFGSQPQCRRRAPNELWGSSFNRR